MCNIIVEKFRCYREFNDYVYIEYLIYIFIV